MTSSDLAFDELVERWRSLIDRRLDGLLKPAPGLPPTLLEAMRYSTLGGGKRLRPLLVLLACDAAGGPVELALPAACAVEMIHTYSLIHDDLPAMDNDDFRRGQPTCHRKFDEATAILAGDGLLTKAFEVLTELEPAVVAARCVRLLAKAAGEAGMVGGQVDDLHPEHGAGDLEWLESLHRRKTGALLTASLLMGGEVASADAVGLAALERYGQAIGLAFQIADDLLDVAAMGKGARKDEAAGKVTFPGILGISASRRRAEELVADAHRALAPFGRRAVSLERLATYIIERNR
jgi:geranylgeranyl diphosphate synthase type II